jgi:hypothetical protein
MSSEEPAENGLEADDESEEAREAQPKKKPRGRRPSKATPGKKATPKKGPKAGKKEPKRGRPKKSATDSKVEKAKSAAGGDKRQAKAKAGPKKMAKTMTKTMAKTSTKTTPTKEQPKAKAKAKGKTGERTKRKNSEEPLVVPEGVEYEPTVHEFLEVSQGLEPNHYRCVHEDCVGKIQSLSNGPRHNRVHLKKMGKDPFPCEVPNCDQGFKSFEDLKVHKKTHREEVRGVSSPEY